MVNARTFARCTALIALALFATISEAAVDRLGPGFYVFFKKPANWDRVHLYGWYEQDDNVIEVHGAWPGQGLANANGWYRGFIDQSERIGGNGEVNLIFSDGAYQKTLDLVRSKNGWYIATDNNEVINKWFDTNPDEQLFEVRIEGGSGSGQYTPGSLVQIAPSVFDNKTFIKWTGDGASLLSDPTKPSNSFQMPDSAVSIAGQFSDNIAGKEYYQQMCSGCHGAEGEGGVGPSLILDDGACKSCSDADSLISSIEQSMPLSDPSQCSGDCAVSVAYYIRNELNGIDGNKCDDSSARHGQRRLRLLTQAEYRNVVEDLFNMSELDALRFWPEPALVKGYENNANANVVSDRHAVVFSKAAKEIARSASLTALADKRCKDDKRCVIETAGLKIFRRPVNAEEMDRLMDLWEASKHEDNAVLRAMLQMPQFLYRSELGEFFAPTGDFILDQYEIASALSFAVTGSAPDDELLSQAKKGKLKEAKVRASEARRLLSTQRAKDRFEEFAIQWLGIKGLPFVSRDNETFTNNIRMDMLAETRTFLNEMIFEQNASVADLYLSDFTFVSKRLAQYYGLSIPSEDGGKVKYTSGKRLGILSHGSILASYSNSHEASPIKRGVFVRNRLLCQELPPPPANVDTTIPPPSPGLTIRERLKRHVSQGEQSDGSNTCFSCHQYIDTVGFGLEAFDATAIARDVYLEKPDEPIDLTGEVKGLESLGDASSVSYSGLPGLARTLAESRRVKQCFANQYYRFSYGRLETAQDRCVLNNLESFLVDGGSIKSFIEKLIADDSFVNRR